MIDYDVGKVEGTQHCEPRERTSTDALILFLFLKRTEDGWNVGHEKWNA
jgi:hypothetical protein